MAAPEFPPNGLTLVSLFAGCGGSSCGYKMAGYDVRLAVDFDEECERIYRANFPSTPFLRTDICSLGGGDALAAARVSQGELDVLDGSPPCQGFSIAGKRELTDSRNRLFEEYVRMVEAFRPRAIVMENVTGLRKGKMRLVFAEMTRALRGCGYKVVCRELNAWWYGVPQDRRRLIWVGVRDDLGIEPSHPEPTARVPVSVAKAIFSSIGVVVGNPGQDGGRHGEKLHEVCPSLMAGGRIRNATGNMQPRLHIENAASTGSLSSGDFSKMSGMDVEIRPITVAEAKVLQGFPEWFEIDVYWPIGNSVAPPMAEAVGRHVAGLLAKARCSIDSEV